MATSKEIVTCGICDSVYNKSKNIPRLLQCLHAFCHPCLEEKLTESKPAIICPTCKDATTIGPRAIDGLPEDRTRFRLIQLLRIQKGKMPCDNCPHDEMAEFFCKNCGDFQCYQCHDLHLNKRNKWSKDHEVINIKSVSAEILQQSRETNKCSDHDQPLIFYCNKKTCEIPVCATCAMSTHKQEDGHQIVRLGEIYKTESADIQKIAEEVYGRLDSFNSMLETEEQWDQDIKKEKEKCLGVIDHEREQLHRIVDERFEKLKADLEAKSALILKKIGFRIGSIRLDQKKCKDACIFTKNTIRYGTGIEVLEMAPTMKTRLQTLNRDDNVITGYRLRYNQNLTRSTVQTLRETNHCIKSTAACISDVEMKTSLNAFRGKRCAVARVLLKNPHGMEEMVSIEDINVMATDPRNQTFTCEVEENADENAYNVYLDSNINGRHCLKITVFGQTIKGGEFTVEVEDEEDSDSEFASAELIESVEEAKVLTFAIDTESVHRNVSVDVCGKTITNSSTQTQRGDRQLQKYQGGLGTISFHSRLKGPVYYEVGVKYNIITDFKDGSLLFEVGLCRKQNVDNNFYVGEQAASCSFHAIRGYEHGAVCCVLKKTSKEIIIWSLGTEVAHNRLSDVTVGTKVHETFGFLFDPLHGYSGCLSRSGNVASIWGISIDSMCHCIIGTYK